MTPADRKRLKISELPEDFYARIKDRLQERIARELRFAGRVLDVGCGSCELARFLAKKNRQHVIGVDISDGGFANNRLRGETVECHKADAKELDFLQEGSVHAVVSLYALHEMHKPVAVLKEANRVLRGGGEVLVVDFPRGSLAERLWNEHYYTAQELEDMLKAAGFAAIRASLIESGQLLWVTASSPEAEARPPAGSPQSKQSRLSKLKRKVAGLEEQIKGVREHIQRLRTAAQGKQRAVVDRFRCTGCGICQELCPEGAIRLTYVASVDAERCTGCGVCVQSCPQGAVRLSGRERAPSKSVR